MDDVAVLLAEILFGMQALDAIIAVAQEIQHLLTDAGHDGHGKNGGKVFAFLTDLGEITPTAAEYIRKANYLILEANYDEEMLRMGTYCLLYTSNSK